MHKRDKVYSAEGSATGIRAIRDSRTFRESGVSDEWPPTATQPRQNRDINSWPPTSTNRSGRNAVPWSLDCQRSTVSKPYPMQGWGC